MNLDVEQGSATACPAPAKLNLFLHVIGRRADGYHELQSVMQFIDLADHIDFKLRTDERIERIERIQRIESAGSADPLAGVPAEDDLTVRAARLLSKAAHARGRSHPGVDISITKRIPMGGGLGGGSSDAATTLLVLNRLWKLNLAHDELLPLALQLGADVPFFIFGRNAFAEGVGERLQPVATRARWFAIVHPGIAVATASIFNAPELTRNTKAIKISDFSAVEKAYGADSITSFGSRAGTRTPALFGHNDLQAVAAKRFTEVAEALRWLNRFGPARMSGSGACVFCPFASQHAAEIALAELPNGWKGWACRSLTQHPLAEFSPGPANASSGK